jgi:hypothetical protein
MEKVIDQLIEQLKADWAQARIESAHKDAKIAEMETWAKYVPDNNADTISIIKQEDGNWKGYMRKFGKLIEVREIKPEDCLIRLLTHSGE